ncbi:MAG TPA: sensor histidine kinase [Bryobacteraceae bacterium]|nr:sensor histidine kinase [Bryobacteraceae bacterium]
MVPTPMIAGGGRRLLFAGFGGLVLLILIAGTDALLVLREVRAQDAQVRDLYFRRSRALDEIRAGIYRSAIVMRDYLLASDPQVSQAQIEWTTIRQRTDAAISEFAVGVDPVEAAPFRTLRMEIEQYWNVLDFMAESQSRSRRRRGAAYFSGDLARRRTNMLDLIDRIDRISASELSSGDAKLNATFDRLRFRLMMMLLITLGAGLLLAAFTIRRTLALESELKKRYDEGLLAQQELKELSASLVSAQEEERRAISRELHDEVGQSLSALLMEAGNAAASVPPDSMEVRRHVESIKKLAEASVNIIRNMTLLLRPSMLDDFGLVPALEWQAREVSKRTGLRVQVAADEASDELPDALRTCIYRIVQEALHNCARHAHARTVKVVVRQEPSRILLTVEDDGRGFDARRVRGLGLVGMEERVTHLGGEFEIDSTPGAGTRVAVELPLAS